MPKIRLTQEGFEKYTGQMGVLQFVDGLSTSDAAPNDARRMAAVMRCEWEGGGDPSNAQQLLDNQNTPAPIFVADGQGTDHDAAAQKAGTEVAAPQEVKSVHGYTQEGLEAIADKDGIKGLRDIIAGDPALAGIKGTSIKELIKEILAGHQLPRA